MPLISLIINWILYLVPVALVCLCTNSKQRNLLNIILTISNILYVYVIAPWDLFFVFVSLICVVCVQAHACVSAFCACVFTESCRFSCCCICCAVFLSMRVFSFSQTISPLCYFLPFSCPPFHLSSCSCLFLKPCGTRLVCPSQEVWGRMAASWRQTAPKLCMLATPPSDTPALQWSPLDCPENQKTPAVP